MYSGGEKNGASRHLFSGIMTGTPNFRVRVRVRISLLGLGSRDIELIQQRDIGRSGYRALPFAAMMNFTTDKKAKRTDEHNLIFTHSSKFFLTF